MQTPRIRVFEGFQGVFVAAPVGFERPTIELAFSLG